MGYRSTVYGVVDEKYWDGLSKLQITKSVPSGSYTEEFTEWVDEDWEHTFPAWQPSPTATSYPARNVHYFIIRGIKWYRGMAGLVDMVETYLHNLPEDTWGMIIIGEESDDNEFMGTPWEFEMYLQRDVDMPGAPWVKPPPPPEPEVEPLENVPVPINWVRAILYEGKSDDE